MFHSLEYVALNLTIQVSVPTFNETIQALSVNGWIVIYQRVDGSMNFNRSWTEYRNGFVDTTDGSFWLGNEAIYQLTKNGNCRGRFELLSNTLR